MIQSLDALVSRHPSREGPLLPILYNVRAKVRHICVDAIRAIAALIKHWPEDLGSGE